MNTKLFFYFNGFAGQSPSADFIIRFFADYLAYILVLAILIYLFFSKNGRAVKIRMASKLVLAGILSRGAIVEGIRFFYHHPRPFAALANVHQLIPESGYSFPSGHATFFFAISAVIYQKNKKIGIAFFIASATMGLARIAAGVHYPLDIFGGAVIGTFVGFISTVIVDTFFRKYGV